MKTFSDTDFFSAFIFLVHIISTVFKESDNSSLEFVPLRVDLISWEQKTVIASISQFPSPGHVDSVNVQHPVFLGSATCLQKTGSETGFLVKNQDRLLDRIFQG
jgi:hypothetical protein